MMRLIKTLFILLTAQGAVHAQQFGSPEYELQPLRFTNRARCALDSQRPASSAFLMISNVDAAKAVYRLAKFRGDDVEETTKLGIQTFRYSVLQMVNLIHDRLMKKELPLLPADITNSEIHIPSKYKNVMRSCKMGEYCEELDDYLGDIWNVASKNLNSQTKFLKLYEVDNYHSAQSYINNDQFEHRRVFKKTQADRELTCAYLKKFSPLQAGLFGTKPTAAALGAIADAVNNQDQKFAACDDFDSQENLQVGAYQLDIPGANEKAWDEKGFDYWNSVKIYLSYAFRHAPEMKQMAYPFASLFQGVILEESVMIVPNGCKALAPPKCDGDRLALNSIREFAKEDFEEKALDLDILSQTPTGPADALVTDMIPSVNVDELDLSSHQSASAWLEKFSGNLASSRALLKKRLIKGITHLNIVLKSMPVDTLISKLDNQFNGLLSNNRSTLSLEEKNELYYLCSEFSFSQHEKWSFIRGNLEILAKSKIVDGLASQISESTTAEFFSYFMDLGDRVNKACYSLRQHDVWDEDFSLDKTGFSPWYVAKVYDHKIKSKYNDRLESYLATNKPLLSFPQYKEDKSLDNVICAHAVDCARKTIQGVLALHSATEYASTFWSLEQKIKSPDLFNPYAERTACKVYDPWFKTRASMFGFLWDMGQAAASAFVPGMIYTRADLQPKMVTSFKKLINDGVIEYDVQYTKQKIMTSLTADFGPLIGVPCSVSVNRSPRNPLAYMRFTGITVGACNSKEEHNLNVNSASDLGINGDRGHSECLSCSLNFESISGVVGYATQSIGPAFFLVRGIYRLYKSLKDPHNIPRSWEVNPYNAAETMARYGEIPKKCVRSLRKGKKCLDACGEKVSKVLNEHLRGHITKFKLNSSGWGSVKHSSCDQEIKLRSYSKGNNSCSVSKVTIPRSCKWRKK